MGRIVSSMYIHLEIVLTKFAIQFIFLYLTTPSARSSVHKLSTKRARISHSKHSHYQSIFNKYTIPLLHCLPLKKAVISPAHILSKAQIKRPTPRRPQDKSEQLLLALMTHRYRCPTIYCRTISVAGFTYIFIF